MADDVQFTNLRKTAAEASSGPDEEEVRERTEALWDKITNGELGPCPTKAQIEKKEVSLLRFAILLQVNDYVLANEKEPEKYGNKDVKGVFSLLAGFSKGQSKASAGGSGASDGDQDQVAAQRAKARERAAEA